MDIVRPRARRRWVRVAGLGAGALVAVALLTWGIRRWRDRAPEVDRGAVLVGTVEHSELRLEVSGPGTLVPEEIRWVSAPVAARVDRILVQPGAVVTAETVLLELVNPDAELAALDADREVADAGSRLATLQASLDGARLAQESTISVLESYLVMAKRRAQVDAEMAATGVVPELEAAEARDLRDQLASRLSFEKKRLVTMRRSESSQLEAQRAEVERLRALAEFRRRQLDALKLRAGVAGVVQELPLHVGQSVPAGAPCAKVVDPSRLKAVLRIPEGMARDLGRGLRAVVDTRSGKVEGEVVRVDPAATHGTVAVDIALSSLPKGARPDLTVDGVIELERTGAILHVARPSVGEAHGTVSLFKLVGDEAVRVQVQLGRASLRDIEIVSGLGAGDQIILSDMSRWDGVDRLRLR